MTEQHIAIVLDVLDREAKGDLSGLEEHPGMQGVAKAAKVLQQYLKHNTHVYYEKLVAGDWVILRSEISGTVLADFRGYTAGSEVTAEGIGMYKVIDGVIVEQHSHATLVERPETAG